jgi:O-antigen/teichoic acid export membrane protein
VLSTAGAAAWFAVRVWLGPAFSLGGVAAIIVLAGLGSVFAAMVLMMYCTVIGEPGVSSRYGILSVVVNVALTVPCVFLGSLGVAGATTAGEVIGAGYVVWTVRRHLHPDLPNPLRSVPVLPALVAAAVVIGGEWALTPLLPSGGPGLLGCAVPAGAGLVVYTVLWQGPRTCLRTIRRAVREGRTTGWPAGIRSVLTVS